jgi:hypothetical protein
MARRRCTSSSLVLTPLVRPLFSKSIPTFGFNVETVDYKNISSTVWDVAVTTRLDSSGNTTTRTLMASSSSLTLMIATESMMPVKSSTKMLSDKELL